MAGPEQAMQEAAEIFAPGSPAYVRGLRDLAMLAAITGIIARSDSAWEVADKVSEWALEQADSAVRALGYQPPKKG